MMHHYCIALFRYCAMTILCCCQIGLCNIVLLPLCTVVKLGYCDSVINGCMETEASNGCITASNTSLRRTFIEHTRQCYFKCFNR